MWLEIDKGAPIPVLDACACCMNSGSGADLRRVYCSASTPDEPGRPVIRLSLPMCTVCRRQVRRLVRGGVTVVAIAAVAAIALGVAGYLMSGIVTAVVLAIVTFVGVTVLGAGGFRLQRRLALRRSQASHAPRCAPLANAREISVLGGGGAARYGVSTLFAVDFANDSFAKLFLDRSSARVRIPGSWSSVGVLFDIDALKRQDAGQARSSRSCAGGDSAVYNYGYEARLIFMKLLDFTIIGAAMIFHGDTAATLRGEARHWCIAVAVKDIAAVGLISNAFMNAEEKGLVPASQRIVHHPRDVMWRNDVPRPVGPEPLPLWFATDSEGSIMLPDPPDAEDIALCERFNRPVRIIESG